METDKRHADDDSNSMEKNKTANKTGNDGDGDYQQIGKAVEKLQRKDHVGGSVYLYSKHLGNSMWQQEGRSKGHSQGLEISRNSKKVGEAVHWALMCTRSTVS